jgi:integrase
VGVYYRKFRKTGRRIWWLSYTVDGRQVFESSHSTSKRFAEQLLAIRKAEVAAGRYEILKKAPALGEWSDKYLQRISHSNTRKRYSISRRNLIRFFGESTQLSNISAARIEAFIRARREEKVKAATVNRDLRFLAQILKQAERERYIGRSPFDLGKFFLNEAKERRKPHVLTWQEQAKLVAIAPPRIRVLTVLGVETGMRTGEMLTLKWQDIDFLNNALLVSKSKTVSGIRTVPISAVCKAELLTWRNLIGPEHSEWVFPSFTNKRHKLQGGRKAWASTLKRAGIAFFPIYNLRHTFASRLTAAGISPITIAQMLGHSSSQIVPRYAQVLDENRLDAMKKLESVRQSTVSKEPTSQASNSDPQDNSIQ